MKIALLGPGKTGSFVAKLNAQTTVFNSAHPFTLKASHGFDAIISFLPGEAFLSYLYELQASRLPVIVGSTGFTWPEDLDEELKHLKLTWIRSHNFSLGMNVVKIMIERMGKLKELYPEGEFKIHEVHHTKKLDAPSGTALSWEQWLGQKASISSERTGDVVGLHELAFDCPQEKIELTHEAKGRDIFAKGALFAANLTLKKQLPWGLLNFDEVLANEL